MKVINVAIAALVSLFGVSVIWLATLGPFTTVIETIDTELSGKVTNPSAVTAIGNLADMFVTGITIFIVLTVVAIIGWWVMKTQEREVVTEAYLY